jgi:hypothetical protein
MIALGDDVKAEIDPANTRRTDSTKSETIRRSFLTA